MPITIIEEEWTGSDNLFEYSITRGIVASVEIAYGYDSILFAKKGDGATQLLMYNDFHPRMLNLEAKTGIKGSDVNAKLVLSGIAEEKFDLMKSKLDKFEDEMITLGFGRNSAEFKSVVGPNRNRFYQGHRTSIENAVLAYSMSMAPYAPMNALALEVKAFHDTDLVGSVHNQQVKTTNVTTDQTVILDAQMDCARGMDKGLGWAKILFADEPIKEERVRKINSCFPLALIKRHTSLEHLGLVNGGTFHQVILHGFKPGEKVYIEVDGEEDLLFWLMPDSKHPCPPTAFRVVKGTHIEDLATVLGNLANRHLMVTATSLVNPSHYILRTIPPPSV